MYCSDGGRVIVGGRLLPPHPASTHVIQIYQLVMRLNTGTLKDPRGRFAAYGL